MNTYQVTYYPAIGSPVVLTIQAKEFVYTPDAVYFADDQGQTVLTIPLALDPVILRTATA